MALIRTSGGAKASGQIPVTVETFEGGGSSYVYMAYALADIINYGIKSLTVDNFASGQRVYCEYSNTIDAGLTNQLTDGQTVTINQSDTHTYVVLIGVNATATSSRGHFDIELS